MISIEANIEFPSAIWKRLFNVSYNEPSTCTSMGMLGELVLRIKNPKF